MLPTQLVKPPMAQLSILLKMEFIVCPKMNVGDLVTVRVMALSQLIAAMLMLVITFFRSRYLLRLADVHLNQAFTLVFLLC